MAPGPQCDVESEDSSVSLTFYSLVAGPICSRVISTPLGAYMSALISALEAYRTHSHFSPTKESFTPQ